MKNSSKGPRGRARRRRYQGRFRAGREELANSLKVGIFFLKKIITEFSSGFLWVIQGAIAGRSSRWSSPPGGPREGGGEAGGGHGGAGAKVLFWGLFDILYRVIQKWPELPFQDFGLLLAIFKPKSILKISLRDF